MNDTDRCVMCGEIIPEGRMVCHVCEHKIMKGEKMTKMKSWPTEQLKRQMKTWAVIAGVSTCAVIGFLYAEKAVLNAGEKIRQESVSAVPSLCGVGRAVVTEDKPDEAPAYTDQELEELAIAIYCEAGSDTVSDECRRYVGDVILNRVESDEFPDTIHDVLTEPYAYGTFSWTGMAWPEYSWNEWETHAVERAYDTARDLLEGNHSWLYGRGYVWQSEYWQSPDSFWLNGFWFGR